MRDRARRPGPTVRSRVREYTDEEPRDRADRLATEEEPDIAALTGWRSALPPAGQGVGTVYAQATIERGRQLAAAGNCVGCHTGE